MVWYKKGNTYNGNITKLTKNNQAWANGPYVP